MEPGEVPAEQVREILRRDGAILEPGPGQIHMTIEQMQSR